MTDTWAAKMLEGVPRALVLGKNENGYYLREADALAAIAKLAEGDGLVERLAVKGPLPQEMPNHYIRRMQIERIEAAAHIAALTAERDAARAERDRYKTACDSQGKVVVDVAGTMDRISPAQLEAMSAILLNPMIAAAEAEAAALRAKVARLEGALGYYADQYCEGFCQDLPPGYTDENCERDCGGCKARAALTDGAADE